MDAVFDSIDFVDIGRGLKCAVVQITPNLARQMLEEQERLGFANVRGTRSRDRIHQYLAEMDAGLFLLTGQSVIYDWDHRLIDAWHRVEAAAQSQRGFVALVVVGVDPEAAKAIDIGKGRTPGESAHASGLEMPNLSSAMAAAKVLVAWERGNVTDRAMVGVIAGSRFSLIDMVEEHQELFATAARMGKAANKEFGITPAVYAAWWVKLALDDRTEDIERFSERLLSGAGLEADDPILALRRWATNRAVHGKRTSQEEWLHALVKTWNSWVAGKATKKLQVSITGTGASRTPIPELS